MQRDPDGSESIETYEGRILELLPSLRRYAHSLARSTADGEDLLHDCLERTLSKRDQWAGGSLKSWAFTIMTNVYRNGVAKQRRFPSEGLDEVERVPALIAEDDPLERRQLAAALDSLAPDHRAVLMLVVVEGYRYREVATILDIPIGTVMSRLARARAQITTFLKNDNIIPLRRTE